MEEVFHTGSGYKGVYHLEEAVNTTSAGYQDATANSTDGTGQNMALTEIKGRTLTVWVNMNKELTIVHVEIENRSQETMEITPYTLMLLDGDRKLIKPFHPRHLAHSYTENASYAISQAQKAEETAQYALSTAEDLNSESQLFPVTHALSKDLEQEVVSLRDEMKTTISQVKQARAQIRKSRSILSEEAKELRIIVTKNTKHTSRGITHSLYIN